MQTGDPLQILLIDLDPDRDRIEGILRAAGFSPDLHVLRSSSLKAGPPPGSWDLILAPEAAEEAILQAWGRDLPLALLGEEETPSTERIGVWIPRATLPSRLPAVAARFLEGRRQRDLEARLQALIENAVVGVYVLQDGRIVRANRRLAAFLGYEDPQALEGHPFVRFIYPPDRPLLQAFLRQIEVAPETEEPRSVLIRFQRPDGSSVLGEMTARPIRHQGRPGVQGLIWDLSPLQRRLSQLETLQEAAWRINASLDLEEVCEAVHWAVTQLMPVDAFWISLNEGTRIHDLYLVDQGQRFPPRFRTPGRGLAGMVMERRQSLLVRDAYETPDFPGDPFGTGLLPRSLVAVPLLVEERVVGAMAVQSYRSETYDEEDKALLEILAGHAAVALENAQRHRDLRRSLQRLEVLRRVSQRLSSTLDPEEVYQILYEGVGELMPNDAFWISVLREDLTLEDVFQVDRGIRYPPTRRPMESGLTGRVISTGTSLWTPDLSRHPELVEKADREGEGELPRSLIIVPMRAGREILGALSTQSYRKGAYTEEDVALLEILAGHAAVAIQNALRYQSQVRRAAELSVLHQIAVAASQEELGPRELLAQAAEALYRHLYPHHTSLFLWDPELGRLTFCWGAPSVPESFRQARLRPGEGITGAAFALGRPVLVPDVEKDHRYLQIHPDTRSELAVPVRFRDQVLGVINVESPRPNDFGLEDMRFLTTLAGQIAAALEQQRLRQEIQRWARELEVEVEARTREIRSLLTLSQRLSQALTPGEVADALLETLSEPLSATLLALLLPSLAGGSASLHLFLRHPADGAQVQQLSEWIRTQAEARGLPLGAEEPHLAPVSFPPGFEEGPPLEVPPREVHTVALHLADGSQGLLFAVPSPQGERLQFLETALLLAQQALERIRLALAAEESRLGALVEGIQDGVMLLDEAGRLLIGNREGTRLYQELCACGPSPFPAPEEDCPIHTPLDAWLKGGGTGSSTWEREVRGRLYVLRSSYLPPPREEEAGTFALHIRDVTEERKAQEQLFQASKMAALGELAAGVAHEINNPLTAVVGFAEILLHSPLLPPELRATAQSIYQGGVRATEIVRRMLAFVREQREPELREVDPVQVVENALLLVRQQIQRRGIDLVLQVQDPVPSLWLAPGPFQQVLLNLINNARDAILEADSPEKRIEIRIRTEGNDLVLEILDTGPGLPPGQEDRIFDPFFTTKEPGKGTGLGLAITYRIVQDHGGTIEAENRPEGGALFRLRFPRIPSVLPLRESQEDRTPPRVRAKQVLIIDDDPAVSALLTHLFQGQGTYVEVVPEGRRGLEQALALDPDLIFLDLRLPGLSGQEVYQALRDLRPELVRRLIFITGDLIRPGVQEFLRQSGQPYLLKPFLIQEVRQAVAYVLAQEERPSRRTESSG